MVSNVFRITLKAARVNKGLSQKEAAEKIGVSNKTLCSWENGLSVPKADKINLICSTYDVAYDNLNFLPEGSL